MARFDDGELYLEFEGATEAEVQRGLVAARQHFAVNGADVGKAMKALARYERYFEQELQWEAGEADHPGDISERVCELAQIAEEACELALQAAGAESGTLGYLEQEPVEKPSPVVRDLFELA